MRRSLIQPPKKGMPGKLPPVNRQQAIFEEKVKQYAAKNILTTPGYLRAEVNHLGATIGNVTWALLENQNAGGNPNVTERRLKISDSFTVMSMAYYLGYVRSGTYNADAWAKMQLMSYPSPQMLPGAGQADNHQAFYNGYISVRVDNTVFMDSYPMYSFYRVGTSQFNVGSTATNNLPVQRDEWQASMWGMNSIVPSIELQGTHNIQIQAALPAPVSTAVTPASGTASTVSVLFLMGFLHQGSQSKR